jgi:hypothetical protein
VIAYKHNGRLHVDGAGTKQYASPHRYEVAVSHLLDRITHTQTGRALFAEMFKRTHKALVIVPLDGVFNAFASADDLRHATLKGHVERSGKDGTVLKDGHGHTVTGLGGGSNSHVKFSPNTFSKYCAAHSQHKSGAQPDEVLFHEMTHAARQMRGVLDPVPLNHLYDTEEEFFAILVANIYASETGRAVDIRSDHHGFEPLAHTQDTSAKFLPKADPHDYKYRLIAKLVREEPALAHALAAVTKAKFNPIRRFFDLQHHRGH